MIGTALLSACASRYDRRFADFNEPHRSAFSKLLRDEPDSRFSRAFRGEADALHQTFARVLGPNFDGAASEAFQFEIMAIRGSVGDALFFDALAKESPMIQRRMDAFARPLPHDSTR